jgi:hypothetical protein
MALIPPPATQCRHKYVSNMNANTIFGNVIWIHIQMLDSKNLWCPQVVLFILGTVTLGVSY